MILSMQIAYDNRRHRLFSFASAVLWRRRCSFYTWQMSHVKYSQCFNHDNLFKLSIATKGRLSDLELTRERLYSSNIISQFFSILYRIEPLHLTRVGEMLVNLLVSVFGKIENWSREHLTSN